MTHDEGEILSLIYLACTSNGTQIFKREREKKKDKEKERETKRERECKRGNQKERDGVNQRKIERYRYNVYKQ